MSLESPIAEGHHFRPGEMFLKQLKQALIHYLSVIEQILGDFSADRSFVSKLYYYVGGKINQFIVHHSDLTVYNVAFWVKNPCRITRKVKQTKMYVCTLEEFILVDIWIHCCASWKWICIGNAVVYIQSQQ